MPQSLSNVLVHFVFSTKDRHPLLDAGIREEIHAYLAKACRTCKCEAYRVGGTGDHIHMACRLDRTISQSQLIETLKTDTSKWIKTRGAQYASFYWQKGYGAFSVSPNHLSALVHYIETQEEHHKKETSQDEYRRLLQKYGMEYDEKYVWD